MDTDGLVVGPWILTPLVSAQWGYDSNPFYESDASPGTAEASERLALGVAGTLPFRSSSLHLGYRRELLDYEKTTLTADTVDDLVGEIDLRFASTDRLKIGTTWTEGVADTLRFDPGGETVFRGAPYRFRDVSAEASREDLGHRGYRVRFSRRDLVFPRETVEVDYFEYRGWDAEGEYRQPLGRSLWGTATYAARRFRHFCSDLEPSGEPCPDIGTPFREELGDAVYVGLRGALSGQSPYSVRLGWLDLRYRGAIDQPYAGPVGDASLRLGFSGRMWLEMNLVRQVYSSFYLENNFFEYRAAQARFGVEFADRWEVGVGTLFSQSRYDSPEPDGSRRRDDTFRAEAYANLFFPHGFGLRFNLTDDRRNTTIDGFDFDRRTFLVGAFFGWL